MLTYRLLKNIKNKPKEASDVNLNGLCKSTKIFKLCRDMHDLIKAHNLVGLSAPLVGVDKSIIAINYTDPVTQEETLLTMINPKITLSGSLIDGLEACPCLEGRFGCIKRYSNATVTYYETNGNLIENKNTEGYLARIIQHEYDLINGVIYLDRLKETNRSVHTNYYSYYFERFVENFISFLKRLFSFKINSLSKDIFVKRKEEKKSIDELRRENTLQCNENYGKNEEIEHDKEYGGPSNHTIPR